MFEQLVMQDRFYDTYSPYEEQKRINNEPPIENVSEICQGIILTKMSVDAQEAVAKIDKLGNKKVVEENMLPFFKVPYAVYPTKSFFNQVRLALVDMIAEINDGGQASTLKQSNLLSLLHIYYANVRTLEVCHVDLKEFFEAEELEVVREFATESLDQLRLLEGQQGKAKEDFDPDEIFQFHIVHVAGLLNKALEAGITVDFGVESLELVEQSMTKAMENKENPDFRKVKRLLTQFSS